MKRIGVTPEFGIPQPEPGLLVSSVSFTPQFETYEQLDESGEINGLVLYKQRVEVELTGEVPYQGTGSAMKLGAAIELANSCPDDCWIDGEKPTGTTSVLTAAPYTLQREGARERTFTGTLYPFAVAAG